MSTLFRATTRVGLCAFVALSVYGCQRRTESQTARVDKLFVPWSRNDTPGCAVGISRNGAVVYEQGYGMANLELGVSITPETVFPIASISKSFTAMSVALAAQQGKLSLDDEVQKYIPEWTDRDDHITIRRLLTHTSGVRDAFQVLGWAPSGESAGDINTVVLQILSRQRGVNFSPGTEYQYNNGGYNLLASIVKRATGQPLREYADANIFKPLGMSHSLFMGDATMLIRHRASGYSRDADGWHAAREYATNAGQAVVGNAGMYSTVGDLLRWTQNFDDVRVGTPEMLAAMQEPPTLKNGKPSEYGFGLGIGQYRGARTVAHSGGDRGMATSLVRFPKQRFAIAVLCNEDSIVMGGMARLNPDVFTNGIADIYLADELGPIAAGPATTSPPKAVKLSEAELAEKSGLYRLAGRDWPVRMTVANGVLMARSYYEDDVDSPMIAVDANHFIYKNTVPLEFVPPAPGRQKEWHVGPRVALLLVTFVPSEADLHAYVGAYRSEDIGVTDTLEARDAGLFVKSSAGLGVTVAPFAKDVFVGESVGMVKFLRDSRGAVTGFTVNRDAARGVRFDRIASSH